MKTFWLIIILSFSLSSLAQEDEESEALKAMRLSCEKQKVAVGCYNYANMLSRSGKDNEVDKYYEMGCKLDHSASCKKEKWDLPEPEKKLVEETPTPTESINPISQEAAPEETQVESSIVPEEESSQTSSDSTDSVE